MNEYLTTTLKLLESPEIEPYVEGTRRFKDSLQQAGIDVMEIYRTGNRLFMIIQVTSDFSFERKASMDLANPVVQKWETLMSQFQKQIPWAGPDVKWVLMERVFKFEAGE